MLFVDPERVDFRRPLLPSRSPEAGPGQSFAVVHGRLFASERQWNLGTRWQWKTADARNGQRFRDHLLADSVMQRDAEKGPVRPAAAVL